MDQNELPSNILNFSDLDKKYFVFRDPNPDFQMSMQDEQCRRRLDNDVSFIERRYKDDQFLRDELIDIKYHMDLCEKRIEKLQIELRNCIFILEKFKEVNVNYGGGEIKIHYVTYQINIIDNFIEVHRNGCREFAKMIEKEPCDDEISNSNYSTLPKNKPSAFNELCSKLRDEGLILDRAKDYCGHCLSQVDIKLATQDFLGLKSQLLIEIGNLEKSSESLKLQKVQIVKNRKF